MGAWFSSESVKTNKVADVLPPKPEDNKIPIRHRPTCLSADIEAGMGSCPVIISTGGDKIE